MTNISGSGRTEGEIVWHDLITTEIELSLGFYKELLGWTYSIKNLGAYGDYYLIDGDDRPLGGFMKPVIPDVPPHWSVYVSVPDISVSLSTIEKLNGRTIVGPLDIPGVGSFAVTLDPEGAAINLFTPLEPGMKSPSSPKPGGFCWNECILNDVDTGRDYYSRLFGWNFKKMSMNMPSLYWVAMCGDREVAGLMKKPEEVPSPPHWLTYVLVKDIDKTVAAVEPLGGKVLVKEIPVPGVGICAVIQDRVGAVLGLFSTQEKS